MAVLEYRDTDGQFKKLIIPGGGGGGISNTEYLSDIKDVKIIDPEKDQILVYDDTTKTWINKKNDAVAELPDNIAYITDSSETKEIKIRTNQHNYSTEEQVVGTWIDGKPLYERTFKTIVNTNGSTEYFSDVIVEDAEVYFIENAFCTDSSGAIQMIGSINVSGNYDYNITSFNLKTGRWWLIRGASTASDTTIIVRYTKTTD